MAMKARSRFALWLAALTLVAAPAWGEALGDTQVRAFLARQERAWNAGDLETYFAAFRPDAVFTDQYRTPSGRIVPYGASTLSQARAQSRKFRAASRISETGQVVSIALDADGRTTQVVSRVVSRIQGAKGLRVTCAERRQQLVLIAGRLRSKGQTDTFTRCPR